MKRIMVLHTVGTVYESFSRALRKALPEGIVVDHVVDEFLANDSARSGGEFSKLNLSRFYGQMVLASQTNPDLIVVTCSTLSPYIEGIRALIDVPVIAIDDAMCAAAVEQGQNICVLATATSALDPAVDKIEKIGLSVDKPVVVEGFCNPEAIAALKRGDNKLHDTLLLELSRSAIGFDIVVLAQASMAHMRSAVEFEMGITTMSSPDMCIRAVVRALED